MVLAVVMASAGCGGRKSDGSASTENNGSDSTIAAVVMPTLEELTLPDTSFQSAEHIVYRVECQDSDVHELKYYDDLYQQSPNVMTFRRNLMRNADFGGRVTGTPADIEIAWTFETAFDTTHTKLVSGVAERDGQDSLSICIGRTKRCPCCGSRYQR